MARAIIDVIIPAYNEELSIAKVIRDIPKDLVRNIIVCNNNSSDATAVVASTAGAIVADEPSPGYGNACLRGMAYIEALPSDEKPDILVFMDGDYSDHCEEMYELVKPILDDGMEMVIGSRALGRRERGSMTTPQVFGNWLSTTLIRWLYGYRFTDLGPYRAIRYPSLLALKMADRNFGWTVEMQVKAAKHKLKTTEIAVNYRKRIGTSKVSGTIKGSISAGYKILWTIGKLWLNN